MFAGSKWFFSFRIRIISPSLFKKKLASYNQSAKSDIITELPL